MDTCAFPIRETPAASVSPQLQGNPAVQEPRLNPGNIQGSILPGFNKSHRILLLLRVDYTKLSGFKKWLTGQIPFVATCDEVIAFNRLFKFTRKRRGREGTVKSTWMNLAFSFPFLKALNGEAAQFIDEAFVSGMADRAALLGDSTDGPYSADKWVVGGKSNAADAMVIIEADDRADLLNELARIQGTIDASPDTGISTIFMDEGANLPAPLTGHEHFGFLDGISQPGVRGVLSGDPADVLTPRQNPRRSDQGKPGQDLVYPGEFVFGYPKQNPDYDARFDGPNGSPGRDSLKDKNGNAVAPDWARDGSFLVYRRLHQDVGAFHRFLIHAANFVRAQEIPLEDPKNSTAARLIGSRLVGRWPSGAPVSRVPGDDAPGLGDDDCGNNYFQFQAGVEALAADPNDLAICSDDGTRFPLAPADGDGARCPFSGHIRKTFPRDDRQLVEPPSTNRQPNPSDTQTRRMLRRGLPYGPVSSSTPESPIDDDVDRGLQFLAYQTSIVDQFEFVSQWANNPGVKELLYTPVNGVPNRIPAKQGGGHDPIIGRNTTASEGGVRTFTVTVPDPADPNNSALVQSVQITTKQFIAETGKTEWVMPAGGGYFFAPSIDALTNHLT